MPKKQWDIPQEKNNRLLKIFLVLVGLAGFAIFVYFLPPVHDRLYWRVAVVRGEIHRFFNPPEEASFSPGQQVEMEAIVAQTQTALAPEPTATLVPTHTPTNYISPTPTQTPSPTPTPTPIPESVQLEGIVHEPQNFNNCGPVNLSMALSYWGWEGSQDDTAPWLKPNQKDLNVMPYEMIDFVRTQTNLSAILRWGGDFEMIKRFIAAGFPVLIERGFLEETLKKEWMGHYQLIGSYDDNTETFLVQDSYGGPNVTYSYERIGRHWQAFNYVYIVIYPPDREPEVLNILGQQADETYNLQYAAQRALEETTTLQGKALFFAWFNYGTSLVNLADYYGAAQAYDAAYEIYAELPSKPWRITWYQTGPYFAYYYTGRYQDVLDLAALTLSYSSANPAIEESHVWSGRAKVALGDIPGAIKDFRNALEWHPDWWVAEQELQNLGVEP